jgi:hypothetical protein
MPTTNVISLSAFKKARERRVKGPPSYWNVHEHKDIPVQRKGIVSRGQLHCPVCGAVCFGSVPVGKGSRTYRAFRPVCGFSCDWSGIMHLNHTLDPAHCPGCAQNPLKPERT